MVAAWAAAAVLAVAALAWSLGMWLERHRGMRRKLQLQGIGGPPPSLLLGNALEMRRIAADYERRSGGDTSSLTADYVPLVFPYLHRWGEQFGSIFTYSSGGIQVLNVSCVEVIKEIGQYKSLNLGKPPYLQKMFGPLFGHGIMTSNGSLWVHQRKVIAPEFFMEKVKGMLDLMSLSIEPLLETWSCKTKLGGGTAEITVDDELRIFSADVISRACFGSSYYQGNKIFLKLRELQKKLAKQSLVTKVFGIRSILTKGNRELWKMEKEIQSLILAIVKHRKDMVDSHENDLLQSILDNASSDDFGPEMTESFIVDNCKNIYFAGHETTAVSATWCLMLLAVHPDWQSRARDEINEICNGQFPDSVMLKKMKVLTMVIQETLRLYPSVAFVTRGALEDLKLGNLLVPKGINIKVLIPALHRNPEIWGSDVHEFKPERFSRGISGACKLPYAFIPFGLGARTCLGQNLAMVEIKFALSIILSRFAFTLSPNYRHSPIFRLTVEPEFGVPLIMRRL